MSFTSKVYDAEKARSINRFYGTLSRHPTLNILSQLVPDLEQLDCQRNTRLVLLCRGVKMKAKLRILNSALMFFAQNYRMKSACADLDWSAFWLNNSLPFSIANCSSIFMMKGYRTLNQMTFVFPEEFKRTGRSCLS